MKNSPAREDRFLMLYIRKNMYLMLILSLGALIFVSAMSSAGSLSFFLLKRSTYLAIDESPVDLIINQDQYRFVVGPQGTKHLPPSLLCEVINSTLHVENITCLAMIEVEVNITADNVNKGPDTILLIGLWTGRSTKFTLSATEILVSQDFSNTYGIVNGDTFILKSTSGAWSLMSSTVGVTSLTFSQLTEQLKIHDSLPYAGYDPTRLILLDQHPFVVIPIQRIPSMLMHLSIAKENPLLFFVKFAKEAFANPWDIDITAANLKELGESLLLDMDNASSKLIGTEVKAVSIRSLPTATILQELSGFISINRLAVFAFGFTIAIIGWYFYSMLSQAVIGARKRELALMHIRGASSGSITKSIGFIVVVACIVGAILGLLLGYLFIVTLTPLILSTSIVTDDISTVFNALSMLFYISFGITASLLSQRRLLSQISKTSLKEPAERMMETSKNFAGIVGIILAFGIGTVKMVSWIFRFEISWEGQATNPVTSAALMFMRLLDRTILDTLGPLFLMYAVVNLVSMRPKILSTISYTVSKALSPPLAFLSKRIMHNKSVKIVGSTIIISLLVFDVVSVQMGHAGIESAWKNLSIAATGADVRVDIEEKGVPYLFQVLNNITGLGGYTQIVGVKTTLGTPLAGILTYMINSSEYTRLVEGIDRQLATTLKSIGDVEIICSNIFHDIGVLDRGDLVTLGDKELVVIDFIRNLPGTLSIPALERFAVVDVKALQEIDYTIFSITILINAGEWHPEDVVENIIENLPSNMNQSYTVATRSSAMTEFSQRMSISQIVENVLSLLSALSIVSIASAMSAIGVWAFNEAKERKASDALLRIRGVTRRQLLGMILSEKLTLFLFALILGFFAGYAMASGYTAYFAYAFLVDASPVMSYGLATQLLTLLGIYLLLFLAPSLYAMRKAVRFHVS